MRANPATAGKDAIKRKKSAVGFDQDFQFLAWVYMFA